MEDLVNPAGKRLHLFWVQWEAVKGFDTSHIDLFSTLESSWATERGLIAERPEWKHKYKLQVYFRNTGKGG